jgi:ABC-type Zn uptake system ZnuABC Zn-binding protein ZnuA
MVRRALALMLILGFGVLGGCSSSGSTGNGGLQVVTTVSPVTDIVRHVAGDAAEVTGVIPEGVDSHTFEPTPETARTIATADVMFVNGLHLEDPTVELAVSSGTDAPVFALGDHTVDSAEYLYDFSFPRSGGKPNPHLWMDVGYAIHYAELSADELGRVDPAHRQTYAEDAVHYVEQLRRLDAAIRAAVATIPEANRVLLTYHDSFAYFAKAYGFRVVGAIQPSSFAEPSAQEVAELIDQIEREHVPAIFGSEVFPSPVLAQIARETGVRFEDTLRDDDLPGEPREPRHSYAGLMAYDVATIVSALGGDPAGIESFAEGLSS